VFEAVKFSLDDCTLLMCCDCQQGIDGVEYLKIPMDMSTLAKFIEEETEDVE